MALSIRLPAGVSRQSLADAWLAVIARHGTLRTAFTPGPDGDPQLHEIDIHPGKWIEHEIPAGQEVNDALRVVLNATCSPYQRPSHRLCVLETAAGLTVVIAADHAHVDMWSMLVIARDLLSLLADASSGRTSSLPQPPAFVVHTQALLTVPRRRNACVRGGHKSSATAVGLCRGFRCHWVSPGRIRNALKYVTCSMSMMAPRSPRRHAMTASPRWHSRWSP